MVVFNTKINLREEIFRQTNISHTIHTTNFCLFYFCIVQCNNFNLLTEAMSLSHFSFSILRRKIFFLGPIYFSFYKPLFWSLSICESVLLSTVFSKLSFYPQWTSDVIRLKLQKRTIIYTNLSFCTVRVSRKGKLRLYSVYNNKILKESK